MKLSARDIVVEVGGRRIVDDVSLDLAPGEIVGLIGPNGAGKSTLLRAIVGVRPRTSGSILLGDDPFEGVPLRERARRVAYLPQERRVEWRLPAEDVVMLGRLPHQGGFSGPSDADRQAVERALTSVDAQSFNGRAISALSGGERARVLLARALAVEAPILLADEPIAALDPYHQLQVMELLKAQARAGTAVLVVLHDLTLAGRFMNRLVLMNQGRVVADGAPETVLGADQLRAVYGVTTVTGRELGERFVIPWARSARG